MSLSAIDLAIKTTDNAVDFLHKLVEITQFTNRETSLVNRFIALLSQVQKMQNAEFPMFGAPFEDSGRLEGIVIIARQILSEVYVPKRIFDELENLYYESVTLRPPSDV